MDLVSKDRGGRACEGRGCGVTLSLVSGEQSSSSLSLVPRGSQACPHSLIHLCRNCTGQSWLGLWTPEAAGRDSHWPLGRQVSDLSHGGGKAGTS